MQEIWKDIPNYNGYQASNLGRIRTHSKVTSSAKAPIRHWKDRIMKPKWQEKSKCLRVELWNKGEHKTLLVHRLVGMAFLGIPSDKNMTINHKDGNRKNNNIDNLEWMSIGDNIRYGFDNGQFSSCKKCVLISSDGTSRAFRSLAEASRFLGHRDGYISFCVQNKRRIKSADGEMYQLGGTNESS